MSAIIHHRVRVSCGPERAFALFADNELLRSWLCDGASVEPRVGGKYELFWDSSEIENEGTAGCRVTGVEPGQLLAFDWKGPTMFAPFMNSADPLTHVVVLFIPAGDESEPATEVHLVHSGWGSTPEWVQAREWFDRVWAGALGRLDQAAAGAGAVGQNR